jgi:hypothetical protein
VFFDRTVFFLTKTKSKRPVLPDSKRRNNRRKQKKIWVYFGRVVFFPPILVDEVEGKYQRDLETLKLGFRKGGQSLRNRLFGLKLGKVRQEG